MANHYGNFNIFGRLSVSQNVSGGYEFPEEIGESNQALGVKDGQLEFIDVEAEIVAGDGIGVVEDPTHTWTVSVTGEYLTEEDISDFITTSEVAGISAGLDGRITTIEDDYLKEADISDFITTSEVAEITGDFVQKSGDTMTGKLNITTEGEALQVNSAGDAVVRLNQTVDGGYIEQTWALQGDDLISIYSNASPSGPNFWGVYDYGLAQDVITYGITDKKMLINPDGGLSVVGDITLVDAPDPFTSATFGRSGINFDPTILLFWEATVGVRGNNYITLERDSSVNDYVNFNADVRVIPLAGNTDEIVTLDADGKLQASGTTVADITLLTTTEAISSNLQTQINEIEEEQTIVVGVSGISVTEDPEHTWIVSGEELDGRISELENTIGTLLQGEVECISGSYVYTIGHPTVDLGTSFPQVSLSVPISASDLYVQGITNRTPNTFDVVLSDSPSVEGYSIYWSMNIGQDALVVKSYNAGFIEVEDQESLSLNAAEYDNFEINATGSGEFTMLVPSNMANGQSINLKIQNVTGGMTISWVGDFRFQNGDAPQLSPSPTAEDVFTILKLSNKYYVSYILNFIE